MFVHWFLFPAQMSEMSEATLDSVLDAMSSLKAVRLVIL